MRGRRGRVRRYCVKLRQITQAPDDKENNLESDVKFELALYYSFPFNRKVVIRYDSFIYLESVLEVFPNKVFPATPENMENSNIYSK